MLNKILLLVLLTITLTSCALRGPKSVPGEAQLKSYPYKYTVISAIEFDYYFMQPASSDTYLQSLGCLPKHPAKVHEEMQKKVEAIPTIEAKMTQLKAFAGNHPSLNRHLPKDRLKIVFMPTCESEELPEVKADFLNRGILFSFKTPDKNIFEQQANILFHEVGHFIIRSMLLEAKVVPLRSVEEAFSDFFANSVSGEILIGKFFDNKSGKWKEIRKIHEGQIEIDYEFGFMANKDNVHHAGEKFRDFLISLREEKGLEAAISTLREIALRADILKSHHQRVTLEEAYDLVGSELTLSPSRGHNL